MSARAFDPHCRRRSNRIQRSVFALSWHIGVVAAPPWMSTFAIHAFPVLGFYVLTFAFSSLAVVSHVYPSSVAIASRTNVQTSVNVSRALV